MSQDHQPGQFEDGSVLPEEKLPKSLKRRAAAFAHAQLMGYELRYTALYHCGEREGLVASRSGRPGQPTFSLQASFKNLALRITPCALRSSHQHARSGLDQNLSAWLSNPGIEDMPEQMQMGGSIVMVWFQSNFKSQNTYLCFDSLLMCTA